MRRTGAFGVLLILSAMFTAKIAVVTAQDCDYVLVESIPQHFALNVSNTGSVPTGDAWLALIDGAESTLDIASFYWTLTNGNPALGGAVGQQIYNALVNAISRGVVVRIAQSAPSEESPDTETQQLAALGAQVRSLNFTEWLGAGILHTKFMIADASDVYLGSANMDWRSLTQVKEFGIRITGCTGPVASDLEKIFNVYWLVAGSSNLPPTPNAFPPSVWTTINLTNPATFCFNPSNESRDEADGSDPNCGTAFLASSPPELCPVGRTHDGDALIAAIGAAQSFIDIEIMDYAPAFLYGVKPEYWADLDTALRSAAFDRNVSIRFLAAKWNHTIAAAHDFYESLSSVCSKTTGSPCAGSIEIRWFTVPDDPSGVEPYTRVNHAKYAITDSTLYITTSNWSADYFMNTGGVSGNFGHAALNAAARALFERDWNSAFVTPLN